MVKFLPEDHSAVSAAATVAVLASATEIDDRSAPPWLPGEEYASQVLCNVISSRSALSGPGIGGQRFAHLQFIIQTEIGREEIDWGITAF